MLLLWVNQNFHEVKRNIFSFPRCTVIQKSTKEEHWFEMNKFFYRDWWVLLYNSLSNGGSSARTFWNPGPLTGKERVPVQTSKDSLLHSNVDCGKAKWVKFCFAWLSFTVPVIVLKSEEMPTTSPGKVSSSLLWKRLLLWWSSQLSSLFLVLCIHVCMNFPCNNSFVIK